MIILIAVGGYGSYLYHSITSNSYRPKSAKQQKQDKKNIKDKKPFSLYVHGNNNDNKNASSHNKNKSNKNNNNFLSNINIDPKKNTTTVTKMNPNHQKENKSKDNSNDSNSKSSNHTNYDKVKNVQQNIGIPSNASYIDINDAKNIVNQSNGITVTPTQTFDSNDQHFTAGKTVNLNGDQALAYAKGGGSNQHQLLSGFISKNGDIKSYLTPSRIKEISSYTKTNLSPNEISQLYQNYRGALSNIQYK